MIPSEHYPKNKKQNFYSFKLSPILKCNNKNVYFITSTCNNCFCGILYLDPFTKKATIKLEINDSHLLLICTHEAEEFLNQCINPF